MTNDENPELKVEKTTLKSMMIDELKQEAQEISDKLIEINGTPKVDGNLISIEGVINWKLMVNTQTKETQVLFNASPSNEGAALALSQQIINSIIDHEHKAGVGQKATQRLRLAQFELQKLFGKCLSYILDNRDKELANSEDFFK